MRKLLLILIAISLLVGITTSFAEDKNAYKPRDKSERNEEQIRTKNKTDRKTSDKNKADKNKIDKRKKLRENITPLIKVASENREKSYQLTQQSKESYRNAKNHIRKLLEEKDSLTDEQVEELKESLEILRNWNKKVVGSRGDIKKITERLRDAKEKRNYDAIKGSYEQIIEIQNSRIENLNKVITDLDNITDI